MDFFSVFGGDEEKRGLQAEVNRLREENERLKAKSQGEKQPEKPEKQPEKQPAPKKTTNKVSNAKTSREAELSA